MTDPLVLSVDLDGCLVNTPGDNITHNIYTALAWNQDARYGWHLGTGELTVTKLRIARRLAELDELLDYCEEWERMLHAGQAHTLRFAPNTINDVSLGLLISDTPVDCTAATSAVAAAPRTLAPALP